ncbi:MAG: diaminopimelate epimerase [Hyphomicrobiaceae bacterium]|nr:diaminopimelate epimerase [Hyphomicrobiaceae bacterium]
MTAPARTIPFVKMNGLGNDFIVVDGRTSPVRIDAEEASHLANRQTGIGCDQVIVLEASRHADVKMRILNADGSEVGACGNATRCVAWLLAEETGANRFAIDTQSGELDAKVADIDNITVDMGTPRFGWQDIPLAEAFHDTRHIELQAGPIDNPILHSPSVVNVGNPHAVFWVDDIDAIDLGRIGPLLENHPIFPERANISIAQIISPTHMKIRTWERGAGLTRACGTAACAAAVTAMRKKLVDRGSPVTVSLPGGDLVISWTPDDRIMMTGPAELEFRGTLSRDGLMPLTA